MRDGAARTKRRDGVVPLAGREALFPERTGSRTAWRSPATPVRAALNRPSTLGSGKREHAATRGSAGDRKRGPARGMSSDRRRRGVGEAPATGWAVGGGESTRRGRDKQCYVQG
jgi:hypothetical protein